MIKTKPIKRSSAVLEIDENSDAIYIILPPFSGKNPPKPSKTIAGEIEDKIVNLDYQNGFLVGIEILSKNAGMILSQNNPQNKEIPSAEQTIKNN